MGEIMVAENQTSPSQVTEIGGAGRAPGAPPDTPS
jgi:hypothetical protein